MSAPCTSSCKIAPLSTLAAQRSLLFKLAKREVEARYKGSALGLLWSVIMPLLMLAVYGFVFSIVFEARFGGGTGAKGEFAVVLFAGLILHAFFSEILVRSPLLMHEQVSFVKKVVFPLEIIPAVATLSALTQLGISFCVFLAGALFVYGSLPLTLLLVPVILLPLVLLTLGLGWAVAALGVYLKDIAPLTGVLSTILLFFSTIFYPASRLPEGLQCFIYLNPLSLPVDMIRSLSLWGAATVDWESFGIYSAVSLGVFYAGYGLFTLARKGFADVL